MLRLLVELHAKDASDLQGLPAMLRALATGLLAPRSPPQPCTSGLANLSPTYSSKYNTQQLLHPLPLPFPLPYPLCSSASLLLSVAFVAAAARCAAVAVEVRETLLYKPRSWNSTLLPSSAKLPEILQLALGRDHSGPGVPSRPSQQRQKKHLRRPAALLHPAFFVAEIPQDAAPVAEVRKVPVRRARCLSSIPPRH